METIKKLNPLIPLAYLCISGALIISANYAIRFTLNEIDSYKENLFRAKLSELYSKNYKHGSAVKPLKDFSMKELQESILYYEAMRDQCTDTLEKINTPIQDYKTQNKLND